MEYRSLELKVGFTVFIAILAFSVGMMWLEGFKLRGERFEIHAVFPMVGGVNAGDAVNVNGVERGEVTKVNLRDRDVIVTMAIDAETKIVVAPEWKDRLMWRLVCAPSFLEKQPALFFPLCRTSFEKTVFGRCGAADGTFSG